MGIILSIEIRFEIRRTQPEAETFVVSYATDTEDDGDEDNLSELTINDQDENHEDMGRIIINNSSNHTRRVYMTQTQPTQTLESQTQPAQNEPELPNQTRPVAEVNPKRKLMR